MNFRQLLKADPRVLCFGAGFKLFFAGSEHFTMPAEHDKEAVYFYKRGSISQMFL